MSSIFARVCRSSKETESSGTGSNDVPWFWVAGTVGLLGASYGVHCYLTSRRRSVSQGGSQIVSEKQRQAGVLTEQRRRSVIPGDFEDLNERIVALIRRHVCDMTGQLQGALRRKEALSSHKQALESTLTIHRQTLEERWDDGVGYKCLGQEVTDHGTSPLQSPPLFQNKIELEVCMDRVDELRQKIAVLQAYLDRGEPVLRLPTDPDSPPEVFTCPITFEVMSSPVVAADGYTYEEESIRKWLRTSRVSPRTNEEMRSTLLQPNNGLRLAIARWRDEAQAAPSKPSLELVTT